MARMFRSRSSRHLLFIVNTASQCGYTSPIQGATQEIYQEDITRIKGSRSSPSRPTSSATRSLGTDDQIKQFCSSNYKVSFPLFSKIVVKGKGIHPLYEFP